MKLFSWIASWFRTSAESIVASIARKVDSLHILAQIRTEEAVAHDAIIAKYTALRNEAYAAAARAKQAAVDLEAQLKGLL